MNGYYWKAIYGDGTSLSQYNADGSKNGYRDIDRSKLVCFALLQVNSDKPIVVLHLSLGQRLIYRRRVAQNVNTGEKTAVYLAGWQETVQGRNVQMICFVFEDGHIEVRNGFDENHPWFYSVNFLPEETL